MRRGQHLFENGKLREALAEFDRVPAGDPLRASADDMRAHIQRELLALALADTAPPAPAPPRSSRAPTGMKCPKCGYLGFETTDRCRNCGYDFSLAAPATTAELPLREPSTKRRWPTWPCATGRQPTASTVSLHEREAAGFGRAERRRVTPPPLPATPAGPARRPGNRRLPAPIEDSAEDLPLFAPRPAGTPLAVRRQGHEVPKARRTTTRPVRQNAPALPLGSVAERGRRMEEGRAVPNTGQSPGWAAAWWRQPSTWGCCSPSTGR